MGKFSDLIDIVFTNTKYSPKEKSQLVTLNRFARELFEEDFYKIIFENLGIVSCPDDLAKKKEDIKLGQFRSDPSCILNGDIREIIDNLEIYAKSGKDRINQIICCAFYMIVTDKISSSKYDSPCEIDKRIKEIEALNDFILKIVESSDPAFLDNGFFKVCDAKLWQYQAR